MRAEEAGDVASNYELYFDFENPPLPTQGAYSHLELDEEPSYSDLQVIQHLLKAQAGQWELDRKNLEATLEKKFQSQIDNLCAKMEAKLTLQSPTPALATPAAAAPALHHVLSPNNPFRTALPGGGRDGSLSDSGAVTSPLAQPQGYLRAGEIPRDNVVYVRDERSESDRRRRKLHEFDLVELMVYGGSASSRNIDHIIEASMVLLQNRLTAGKPALNYLAHIRFLIEKKRVYTSASLIRYDLATREQAEFRGGESTFEYCNAEYLHRFLGVENMLPRTNITPTRRSGNNQRQFKARDGQELKWGLCWKWNANQDCTLGHDGKCNFKHLCNICYADHRASTCKKKNSQAERH